MRATPPEPINPAQASGLRVASFDVFDTILTRTVGSPESVFLLLGKRLATSSLIHCSPEEFAQARLDAERLGHEQFGAACTLRAIYDQLGNALSLNQAQRLVLYEQECALESQLIRVIPGAADRIAQARSVGQLVVFISDMYLPTEFVRQLLQDHHLWMEGDRCYVSCAKAASKQTGALYYEMLDDLNVPPDRVTHQGNSEEADIHQAVRAYINITPFLDANLNRYEHILEGFSYASSGLSSAMAGASRLSRLSTPGFDAKQAAVRDVSAGVAAPVLVAFVLWILRRSSQLGLERLYFVSRDGQVLVDIARGLAKKLGLPIELFYLFGSRQSWNLAAIFQGSEKELEWIWDSTDRLSAEKVLARLDLEPGDVAADLGSVGPFDWSAPIQPEQRRALRALFQRENVRQLILERARKRRDVLVKYFDQEGVLAARSWGFVDLGWYGNLQNALDALLLELGRTPPVGLYFALYKGKIPNARAMPREAFLFDEYRGSGSAPVPVLIALMEMFCAADHGTVIDFVEEDGIKPLLKETCNQKVVEWGLATLRQTIASFVENLMLEADLVDAWADVRTAITNLLQAFWLHPSLVEATAWADFPWEDGLGAETSWNPLAQRYTWKQVLGAFRRMKVEFHHRSSWFEGSLALSSPGVRISLVMLVRALRTWRILQYRVRTRLRTSLGLAPR